MEVHKWLQCLTGKEAGVVLIIIVLHCFAEIIYIILSSGQGSIAQGKKSVVNLQGNSWDFQFWLQKERTNYFSFSVWIRIAYSERDFTAH